MEIVTSFFIIIIIYFLNALTKSTVDLGRWKIQLESQHPNLEALREFLLAGMTGAKLWSSWIRNPLCQRKDTPGAE